MDLVSVFLRIWSVLYRPETNNKEGLPSLLLDFQLNKVLIDIVNIEKWAWIRTLLYVYRNEFYCSKLCLFSLRLIV